MKPRFKIILCSARRWSFILTCAVACSKSFLTLRLRRFNIPNEKKTIEARSDGKGIRLDVYVEDANEERWFDVEMQVADSANLAKRMRYYQGLIDLDKLKRGQHYGELGKSFIIFICPFDHFKQGRHVYTFRERCDQDTALVLEQQKFF